MNQKIIHNFRTFLNNNLYAEILINDMTMNNITWEKFLVFVQIYLNQRIELI